MTKDQHSTSGIRYTIRRWAAVLSSCLIPGAGHLIMGSHTRGLLLMALAALDVAAIVRFADAAGGKHLLLIVYLGMALPVLYFYGVYSILQATAVEQPDGDAQGDAQGNALSSAGADENASSDERPEEYPGLLNSLMILGAGMLLLLLLIMPDKLRPVLDSAGVWAAPILLIGAAAWIAARKRSNGPRLGRWTAAALAAATGVLLGTDNWTGRDDIALLGSWWPVLFVLIGIELVLYSVRVRRTKQIRRLSADASAVTLALVIAVTAYGITQYAELPYRWLDQWAAQRNGYTNYSEEKGFSYDKPAVAVDPSEDLQRIVIDNPNGSVQLKRTDSGQIAVEYKVWVDSDNEAEADAAAEKTEVVLTPGEETTITTSSAGFGPNGERKPRVNITVYLPPSIADAAVEQLPSQPQLPAEGADMQDEALNHNGSDQNAIDAASSAEAGGLQAMPNETNTPAISASQGEADAPDPPANPANSSGASDISESTNDESGSPDTADTPDEPPPLDIQIKVQIGDVHAADISAPVGLTIDVGDGRIEAYRIAGTVSANTVNGSVKLMQIDGDIAASADNGSVDIYTASGNVTVSTANGGIHLNDVQGDAEVDTKNGEVAIHEAGGRVKADTLNGSIEAYSGTVGGDWDIVALVGEVRLRLPPEGNYEMNGSVTFGTINVEAGIPLAAGKKTVRGQVGAEGYRIYVNANNNITIGPFYP